MEKQQCILSIPLWDKIKIHISSFFFGVWVVCKMLFRLLWDSKTFFSLNPRDNPPPCLVDSFLGQHKYVKLKGVKFHYVESGSKNQSLILLLHGFPDCWLSWRYQIPILSEHFRVVALDLKGFGDSDKPSSRYLYRIDIILDELKTLISTLGESNCTIIGHDIGALLGWYLAHQCPQVVNKLIVVSCPHPNEYRKSLNTTLNYKWLKFVQLPYLPEIDALKEDVKLITEYHKHLTKKDEYLEAYKYSFSRKEDWSGALNYHRNFPYIEISENSILHIPVILLNGDRDKYVKLESMVKSTDYCEKFYLKIIDDSEHFPHQEKPHKFNEILLNYLIGKNNKKDLEKSPTKGLMNKVFGAVSNTVKYGNSVLDTVQKKTNGVGIPSISLLNYNSLIPIKTDSQ